MTTSEVDKILEDKERMAVAKIEDEFSFSSSDMAREIYRLRQGLKVIANEIDKEIKEDNKKI